MEEAYRYFPEPSEQLDRYNEVNDMLQAKLDEIAHLTCPKCGSSNSYCYDESYEWYECDCGDDCDDEEAYISNGLRVVLVEMPVGYFVCRDCRKQWKVTAETDCKYIGDDRAAGIEG